MNEKRGNQVQIQSSFYYIHSLHLSLFSSFSFLSDLSFSYTDILKLFTLGQDQDRQPWWILSLFCSVFFQKKIR
jgi:hypothetical protein